VGLIEDNDNRNELAKLSRWFTTKSADSYTSLDEYVSRMKEDQKQIYYITGETKKKALASPALEKAAWFYDVDGTLLEIKPEPDAVVCDEDLRSLLERLFTRSLGALALVSGRSLDDIDRIFSPLKLTAVGNSAGVVFSREVLARLKVDKGDTVYLTESADGYRLTPYSPEFEAQMIVARRLMKKWRNVLHELAK
jgi:putative addiction module antidote